MPDRRLPLSGAVNFRDNFRDLGGYPAAGGRTTRWGCSTGPIRLLAELGRRRGMALILISHDLGAIARVTDRLAVMYGGDIVETGPTAAVLAAPRHPYTAGLIAARPRLAADHDRRRPLPAIPGQVPPLARLPAGCRFAGRCGLELPACATSRPAARSIGPGWQAACLRLEGAAP
jgi:peptide/nickel transport system ATP-binding protein